MLLRPEPSTLSLLAGTIAAGVVLGRLKQGQLEK